MYWQYSIGNTVLLTNCAASLNDFGQFESILLIFSSFWAIDGHGKYHIKIRDSNNIDLFSTKFTIFAMYRGSFERQCFLPSILNEYDILNFNRIFYGNNTQGKLLRYLMQSPYMYHRLCRRCVETIIISFLCLLMASQGMFKLFNIKITVCNCRKLKSLYRFLCP